MGPGERLGGRLMPGASISKCSRFICTQSATRAPSGQRRGGRSIRAEYPMRGSMVRSSDASVPASVRYDAEPHRSSAARAYTPAALTRCSIFSTSLCLMSGVVVGELAAGGDAAGAVGEAADAILEHRAGVAGDSIAVGRGIGHGLAVDALVGPLHGLHQRLVAFELETVPREVQFHLGLQLRDHRP